MRLKKTKNCYPVAHLWCHHNQISEHFDLILKTFNTLYLQVKIEGYDKLYNAHIQELKPNKGPASVFVEDLGEK